MDTIRLRTIEGRRMRDPAHPKRAVVETGDAFDIDMRSPHANHWMRRLRDGDVEEVLRKARIVKGCKLTLPPEKDGDKPRELAEGAVAEISALDDHWRAALDRGDAELVPEEPQKEAAKPVSDTKAPIAVNASNNGGKPTTATNQE